MYRTEIVCKLSGADLDPAVLSKTTSLSIIIDETKGDMKTSGRYKGSYSIITSVSLSPAYRSLDTLMVLAKNLSHLLDSGVSEIYFACNIIYFDSDINLYLTAEQIKSLAALTDNFDFSFLISCYPE